MALNSRGKAALGLHRFGFGAKAGILEAVAADPKDALLAELNRMDAGRIGGVGLLSSGEAARQSFHDIAQRLADRRERARKENAEASGKRNVTMGGGEMKSAEPSSQMSMDGDDRGEDGEDAKTKRENNNLGPTLRVRLYVAEGKARTEAAVRAETGFVERLVWFWSNHFCIDARKSKVRAVAGPFEREAIRPYMLGRFADMLLAATSHPAMLLTLDNASSSGPNSPFGRRRERGLNENHARELLELHTLGVRTVYTQEDVTTLAKVLTGWTVVNPRASDVVGGEFEFSERRHEPGAKTVLGRRYPDAGVEQGRMVLRDLARHPATARNIATKLAIHFVADTPPQTLIDHLAQRFLDSDGDLKEVAKSLLNADEAWVESRSKIRRPSDWIVAALRTGEPDQAAEIDVRLVLQAQELLGEPLWRPPSPKGFSDAGTDWINALSERLDVAKLLARRLASTSNPIDLLDQALGPLASTATRQAVARAEDRSQALALMLMAPEFQRR